MLWSVNTFVAYTLAKDKIIEPEHFHIIKCKRFLLRLVKKKWQKLDKALYCYLKLSPQPGANFKHGNASVPSLAPRRQRFGHMHKAILRQQVLSHIVDSTGSLCIM